MSQAQKVSTPYIIIESFSQFLVLKIISNQYVFRSSMFANEIIDIGKLFTHEVIIVFKQNPFKGKKQAVQALKNEGITIRQSTNLPKNDQLQAFLHFCTQLFASNEQLGQDAFGKLQTFDQLCSIVFGSPSKYSILINDFNFNIPNDTFLEDLFGKDEQDYYQIEMLEKDARVNDNSVWYLIKAKDQNVSNSSQLLFSCQNLKKLGSNLTINIRQVIDTSNKYQDQKDISIMNEILQYLAIDKKQCQLHFEIGTNITVYFTLNIKEIQSLVQGLKLLCKRCYNECIDWNFQVHKILKLSKSKFNNFIEMLKRRMGQEMKRFNITKWNDIYLDQQPDIGETQIIPPSPVPSSPVPLDPFLQPNDNSKNQVIKLLKLPNDSNLLEVLISFKSSLDQKNQNQDILQLQDLWPRMSVYFSEILNNWQMFGYNLQPQLRPIFKVLDYRLNKFRIPYASQLMKNSETQLSNNAKFDLHFNNFFSLCDYLYPRMSYIIQEFSKVLNQKMIKQKIREKYLGYIKRSDEKVKVQQKVIKNSQFNQSIKLPDHQNNGKTELNKQKNGINDINKFDQYINIVKQVIKEAQKQLKNQGQKKQNVLDSLMMDFFEEIDSQNSEKGSFYIKIEGFEKKQLKQFIGQIIAFQQKVFNWQDVFNVITLNTRRNDKKIAETVDRLDLYIYSDTSCLGCAQFFILNKSIVGKFNNTPLRIFSHGSISKSKKQITEEICSMLNNRGGIILFNCIKNYGIILPKGAYLTDNDKKRYVQQISEIVKLFYPVVKLNEDIFISFVPIVINNEKKSEKKVIKKYEDTEKQSQYYESYQPIDGFYIMRIRIVTKDQTHVYFWQQSNQKYVFNRIVNSLGKKIPFNKIRYAIQQKINKYSDRDQFEFRPQTFGNPSNHQCKKVREVADPTIIRMRSKQVNNYQKMYKYMTLIVVKRQNIQIIRDVLSNQNHRIQIQSVFQRYVFGLTKYTSILYHDSTFPQLLTIFTNNKRLIFDQKRVLAILIRYHLKVDSPTGLNPSEILNARQWLKQEFPEESLSYYKLINQEAPLTTYYIKTKSKFSTLFLYYVLNHYKIKVFFKNPSSSSQLIELK